MARVVVRQGELLGKVEKLTSGNTFASFKGIPYAAPPVGKQRFKVRPYHIQNILLSQDSCLITVNANM